MKIPRFLLTFFLVALVLRMSVLTWGVGIGKFERNYHADEGGTLRSVMGFPKNYAAYGNFLYGTSVQYTVGTLLLPVKIWWDSAGPITHRITYKQLVHLTYRALNCLLGALCVILCYRLAITISDPAIAAVAAGLTAISFYHCMNSALTTLDVTMSFLVLAALILSIRAFRSMKLVDFGWLGFVSGMLFGTKISGCIFALTPATMAVFAYLRQRNQESSRNSGDFPDAGHAGQLRPCLLLSLLVALIVFIISTPQIYLWPLDYLDAMQFLHFMWVETAEQSLPSILFVWMRSFSISLTPVVLALAGMGIILGFTRHSRMDQKMSLAILASLMGTLLFWRGLALPRYLIVFSPIMCIYAALSIMTMLRSRLRLVSVFGGVVLGIAVAHSLYTCCMGIASRYSDTRTDAARFISKNLPEGARIAFASSTPKFHWSVHNWRYPAVDESRFKIVGLFDRPDFIIIDGYTLSEMGDALKSGLLDNAYRWPKSETARWYNREIPPPATFRFFDEIFRNRGPYALVESWSVRPAVPIEFPPPDIQLYRLKSTPFPPHPDA